MEAFDPAGYGAFGVILASKIWLDFIALTEDSTTPPPSDHVTEPGERRNFFQAYARLE